MEALHTLVALSLDYVDAQLVLAAPLARGAAPQLCLLITGVGGSLGAVIAETGLDKIPGGLFSAESGTPVLLTLLLAWFVAAVLPLAIGSISDPGRAQGAHLRDLARLGDLAAADRRDRLRG